MTTQLANMSFTQTFNKATKNLSVEGPHSNEHNFATIPETTNEGSGYEVCSLRSWSLECLTTTDPTELEKSGIKTIMLQALAAS